MKLLIHKNSRIILLALVFLTRTILSDSPTPALNIDDVHDGELISNITYGTPNVITEINFHGRVAIDGDIVFTADPGKVLRVSLGKNSVAPTYFEPLLSLSSTPTALKTGNLIFAPQAGGMIFVDVYTDLYLTGSNVSDSMLASTTDPAEIVNTELGVIFRGKGTTFFNIVDGKSVVATSLIEINPTTLAETDVPASLSDRKPCGTAMYVAMDQTLNEVVGYGLNKVIFQRKDFNLTTNNNDVTFKVGLNSFFTFISYNYSGLDDSTDPLHNIIPRNSDGTRLQSYAAVAFDVSNAGTGRMVLNVAGPDIASSSYTDGAFVLGGHYLQDRADNSTALPGSYQNSVDVRSFVNFSQAAGCKSYLRVIDNQNYFFDINLSNTNDAYYIDALNPSGNAEVGVIQGQYSRRGLTVLCSNKSIASLASNPYGDSGWYLQDTFFSGRGNHSIRPGFVLGINGHIEVNHNTFFEYEAQNNNMNFEPLNLGMTSLDGVLASANITNPGQVFKQRNPSAMLVDGLGSVIVSGTEKIKFTAHVDQTIVRRAEITLYGNASVNFRTPLLTTLVGSVLTPSRGLYDGKRVAVAGETLNDGVFVLDLEGPLTIRSLPDQAIPTNASSASGGYMNGLHFGSNYPSAGTLRFPTIWRSFDDREILDTNNLVSSYITRPLSLGVNVTSPVLYARYDRPTCLFNDKLDLINLDYHHDDITRYIKPNVAESPPIFCGGERASFLSTVFGVLNPDLPQLRLYNSKIHCHESLCASGIRIVMRELPDILSVNGVIEQNISSIIMYNHGDRLDTNLKGFGRIFLMGSLLNKTAAEISSPLMENTYFNIFRGSGGDPNTGANPVNLPVTLSLATAPELAPGAGSSEKAIQLFFLGNNSNVELGWSSEVGLLKDSSDITIFPWDHQPSSYVTSNSNKFNIRADQEAPATLSFDGDFISLGGIGPNGEPSPQLVTDYNLGRVIYLGHGSKIQITSNLTDPSNPQPYIGFSNAAIAMQLWKADTPSLNAQVDLPFDQMVLSQPIQPLHLDMNTLTDTTTANQFLRISAFTRASTTQTSGNKFGTTAYIPWDQIVKLPGVTGFRGSQFRSDFSGWLFDVGTRSTRAINRITSPVQMPSQGLLAMASGDYLDQLSVSGATLADPFLLYMTGDVNGISQVREFVSVPSPLNIPGEGSFAKIYMDQGARVGLGDRNWNEKSPRNWGKVGRNLVTLVPNGDCQIDINSDIIMADSQPIIPTVNFGSAYVDPNNPTLTIKPQHRITFFSHDQREVRIQAGKELDLSAFGSANTDQIASQQIAFGGKIKLIFEPGSTLRFPSLTGLAADKRPVIYMNEESQIIFEGIQDMNNKFIGNPANRARWEKIRSSDRAKVKIVGTGDIWINKTSKMIINDGAIVAIEADSISPQTNVTISLQRQGTLQLGDQNVLGGSLQIGCPRFNADDTAFTLTNASVNFSLRLNSQSCLVELGRNAFLGFGVGIVDKFNDTPNGLWKLQQLKYVNNINIRNISGIINHNQIYDGTSGESSLIAVGPATNYKFEFGSTNSIVKGGGNIIYVADAPSGGVTDLVTPSIGSTVVSLTGDATDTGKYSLLNSSFLLQKLPTVTTLSAGSTVNLTANTISGSVAPSTMFSESSLNGGYGFSGTQADAFRYLSMRDLSLQPQRKFVAIGKTPLSKRIGYVFNGAITRTTSIPLASGVNATDLELITNGVLEVANINADGSPSNFKLQA